MNTLDKIKKLINKEISHTSEKRMKLDSSSEYVLSALFEEDIDIVLSFIAPADYLYRTYHYNFDKKDCSKFNNDIYAKTVRNFLKTLKLSPFRNLKKENSYKKKSFINTVNNYTYITQGSLDRLYALDLILRANGIENDIKKMANYNEMNKADLLNLLNLKLDTKCYTFEIINNRADLKFKDKKFPQIINEFYEKNIEEIENTPTNITYL